jgi:MFS family permease
VLQAGALVMALGAVLYAWEVGRYGAGLHSWQMILPLLVMGAGMGLIVAPLTDAVLSDVPREHAGSASGLINTTMQLGAALGMGLVSVCFLGVVEHADRARHSSAQIFGGAFTESLWWVAGGLLVAFVLMFALPGKAAGAGTPVAAGAATADEAELALVR